MNKNLTTVDDHIMSFAPEIQERLRAIRQTIKDIAPDAIESIIYGMPAYKLNKQPLVYFGGHAKHVGFYATPEGHDKFKEELSKYKHGKGSVQFPHDQPLPLDLIAKIVKFKVTEIYQK